jgi:hypothetical protein
MTVLTALTVLYVATLGRSSLAFSDIGCIYGSGRRITGNQLEGAVPPALFDLPIS